MTTQGKTFFEKPREWSRRKHELLRKYLPPFARILGRSGRAVYVVDAFAGRGYYGSGDSRHPGSPVQAALLAQDLAAAPNRSYRLRCINVEADEACFSDLVRNTRDFAEYVYNYQGAFAANLDSVLTRTIASPTLFFLDPFGLSGLEWETLKRIAERPGKTEFLINLNVPKFDQHAGWLDSFSAKHRTAFIDLLNRVTGCEDWQEIWDEPLPAFERYERIINFYRQRIETKFRFKTAAYPVRTVKSGQLKYYMVFATREPLAIRIMSSIVYGVDEEYLGEVERAKVPVDDPLQPRMFDIEPVQNTSMKDALERYRIEQLERDILEVIQGKVTITFERLQDTLMSRWFGRVAEKHFRAGCQLLEQAGLITKDTKTFKPETAITLKGNTH